MDGAWHEVRRGLWEHALTFDQGVDRWGRSLAWLLDCRAMLSGPGFLPHAGRLLWARVRPHAPDLVGGLTLAADPLTAAVLYEAAAEGSPVGGFTVRRTRKRSGLRKLVEGQPVLPGSRVVLLDDVLSSGRSLLRAHDAVTAAGAVVVAAVVLVDYGRPRLPRFARLGVPVEAPFTLVDLGLAARPPGDPGAARFVWRYPGVLAAQAHHGGVAAITADGAALLSLADDGTPRWRYPAGVAAFARTAPVVCHDRVLAVDSTGTVHCVDASSGKPLWTSTVVGGATRPVTVGHDSTHAFVASTRGGTGLLTALRLDDGGPVWTRDLPATPAAAPVVDERCGDLVLGLSDGRLTAIRAVDGHERRAVDGVANRPGRPALAGDLIVHCGADGRLSAFSRTGGRLVWRRRLAARLAPSPVVAGHHVVVGGDHKVVGMDAATGRTRWVARVAGLVAGGVSAVGHGLVAAGSVEGEVSLIDAVSGCLLWTHQIGAAVRSAPTAGGNLLAVTSADGCLHAFVLTGGSRPR